MTNKEKLEAWIAGEIKKARDNGEEFFLDHPEAWYNAFHPFYADINGHISRRTLKSSEKGTVCMECYEPVYLVPPGTTEDQLFLILN